jgi:hypothetical protein
MGMGLKCSFQGGCRLFEEDNAYQGCCKHHYWSDLEEWCSHPAGDVTASNFPPKETREKEQE